MFKGIDPLGEKRNAKTSQPSGVPSFGQCADLYLRAHEASWRSAKHARQWTMTLREYAAPLRDMPVDQIATEHVLACLQPLWLRAPETGNRVRARVEVILASAQVAGHIPSDRPNVARWRGWLDHLLPNPRRAGKPRQHHPALPYDQLPSLMAKLAEIDTTASRALMFTILTCARSGETLGARWSAINFETGTWSIEASRMKMQKPHSVPLSSAALDILRVQLEKSSRNPFIFPGRPTKPLSPMAMSMLLRRLGVGGTVHGMRSAARSWMGDTGVEFSVAETCLAHSTGNQTVAAYMRSDLLARRRPIMESWGRYVSGETDDNVVPLKRGAA